MMKIFRFKDSSIKKKRFLIPKGDNQWWVEIEMDFEKNIFKALKFRNEQPINFSEWEEYSGYTFPSSLLNEFLNTNSLD